MSAPTKPTESPARSPPESPTTVAPFEMSDDDTQEGTTNPNATASNKPAEDTPPPKPPRPLSPQQQAENTLKEAFPSIDAAVVKAVLIASGGRVEPAFNALLGMTDPDAAVEVPPPQPPRPQAPPTGSTPQSQVEADEQYARQLAEHYGGGASYGPRAGSRGAYPPNRQQTGLRPNEYDEEEHSFLDDDLPVIKENLRKGFLETQSKVNGWITNLKKKLDGDEAEDEPSQQNYNANNNAQSRPRRSGEGRQSGDYNRYDADPQLLGDDFAGIQLNDDGSKVNSKQQPSTQSPYAHSGTTGAQRRSTRPLANPDLFKPIPGSQKADGRKVSFQSSSQEDLYGTSPKLGGKENTPSTKQSKWQPLSAIEPGPIGDADNDHDPFSLGDSEDEKESKDRVGGKEIRMEDAERLKKAAAEAMSDNIVEPAKKQPEPAETSGTKDKLAEELANKT